MKAITRQKYKRIGRRRLGLAQMTVVLDAEAKDLLIQRAADRGTSISRLAAQAIYRALKYRPDDTAPE